MGSGISKKNTGQLVCPEGYDKEKFKQILYLYDKLDTNGDMVIEKEELFKLIPYDVLITTIRTLKLTLLTNTLDDKNKAKLKIIIKSFLN